MPQTTLKTPNNFYSRAKVAIITAVYPQTRTVDIEYTSQSGNYKGLLLPYTSVGLTSGTLGMPMVNDKVIIDYTDGDRPYIVRMYVQQENLLPYAYPGEQGMMGANGSFVHVKEPRKRVKSTGELLNYNATAGANGETDFEYEPGGITLQVQSRQSKDGNAPRYDKHGYVSLFDNGTVAIHSIFKGSLNGMLHMDGPSGHVWLSSGNSSPQEYIELDPVMKTLLLFSDLELHRFAQGDSKDAIYGNIISQNGGGIDIKVGLPLNQIPGNFKNITTSIDNGDISIDNSASSSGITNLNLKGNFTLNVIQGNISINAQEGTLSIASKGDMNLSSQGNLTFNATNLAFNATENSTFNHSSSNLVDSATYNRHVHHDGPPGSTSIPDPLQGDNDVFGGND